MRVIMPDRTVKECPAGMETVEEVLAALGINPVAVIVTRNNTLVAESAPVSDEDELRIIAVSHGG